MRGAGGPATITQWPFIGVVVLLLVLILITPDLTATGPPPAGSLQTQAELVIDGWVGANETHLYVRSIGTVRYAAVDVGVTPNVSWPAPASGRNLTFSNWTNETNTLVLSLAFALTTAAVNASAVYVDASGTTVTFIGLYVFHIDQDTLYVTALLAGLGSIPPTPLADLPVSLLLMTAPGPGGS